MRLSLNPPATDGRRAWRPAAPIVPAALTAVLLAACGGSNNPSGTGSSGSSHRSLAAANVYKYPECMRDHGVTNFPDPQVHGNSVTLKVNPSITESPAFKSARQACADLLPAGAGQLGGADPAQQQARDEGLLAFAACIRNHGFPTFPDPSSQGQLTIAMIARAGINLRQPAVLQAGDACVPASRGQVTKGDVAQAIAQAGGSQSPGGG